MKIATFNINNVNKRLPNLLAWLRRSKPDVVCLQELKVAQRDFPSRGARTRRLSKRMGRAEDLERRRDPLTRGEPVVTQTALPGDPADTQSRYIEAAVNGILIASLYAPNGNPQPGPKFDYKLAWLARLARHSRTLLKSGAPVVLAGDYNVVPTPFDIYPTKSWEDDALVQPESRAAFAKMGSPAGPMRSARCIPTRRCSRSGIICGTASRAMPAFGSIICCSARGSRSG